MTDDLISRQAVADWLQRWVGYLDNDMIARMQYRVVDIPSADSVEVVRCKDCIYGYLYIDVQNGITDSWIECRNPEGLNRDVSVDGYCYASIRRRRTDE